MLIDYKTSGYPHMFQLQWRANFPTEDEGIYMLKKLIINILKTSRTRKVQRGRGKLNPKMAGHLCYVGLQQCHCGKIISPFFQIHLVQVSLYLNGNKAPIKNRASISEMKVDFRESLGWVNRPRAHQIKNEDNYITLQLTAVENALIPPLPNSGNLW